MQHHRALLLVARVGCTRYKSKEKKILIMISDLHSFMLACLTRPKNARLIPTIDERESDRGNMHMKFEIKSSEDRQRPATPSHKKKLYVDDDVIRYRKSRKFHVSLTLNVLWNIIELLSLRRSCYIMHPSSLLYRM